MEPVRIDQYLTATRIYKSRNGIAVKPSHGVAVGDEVRCVAPRGTVVLKVLALASKRLSPPLARALYEDHSPPPPPREERMPQRDRGAGRPTKADRRAMQRLRGDDFK